MSIAFWTPHKDSESRKASAIALASAVLQSRSVMYASHVREVLSIAVWKYTECDGKYTTRFRSEGAMFAKSDSVHHEHVVTRKSLVERLLAEPHDVSSIFADAIGCVVLRSEHTLLAAAEKSNPSLSGWDRYRHAGIVVWDLQERTRVV
jgi:hypothetical protein